MPAKRASRSVVREEVWKSSEPRMEEEGEGGGGGLFVGGVGVWGVRAGGGGLGAAVLEVEEGEGCVGCEEEEDAG